MKKMTVHYEGQPIYDIIFHSDFSHLASELTKLSISKRKICVVSDSHVAPLYMEQVKNELAAQCMKVTTFVFQAGEASKNLDTVKQLYTHLIEEHFERGDMLIALGGGVVGDLTGYTAATYLRGIDFIQIPTSLLAQVDSSIGGKTGVDFDSYKNMVGAFHQPQLVYMNLKTLDSLSERQYCSGMGEIIKHGLIMDAEYYQWIKTHTKEILDKDYDTLLHMISTSCNIKRKVVEEDPKEKGKRAWLNYGHTLGHAIEKLTNFSYLHGECVAVGVLLSLAINVNRETFSKGVLEEYKNLMTEFTFPKITQYNIEQVLDTVQSDKKMEQGQVKFILLNEIGSAVIDKSVTTKEMKTVLEAYQA